MTAYLLSIATAVGFYMLLGLALNLQWGQTGQVNFGVAGFYALGAYTSALVTERLGLPFAAGIALAAAVGLGSGALLAFVSVRLAEDFLAIVTLGFAEIVHLVALNEDWLTRGPRGLAVETRPFPAGLSRDAQTWASFAVVLLAVLVAYLLLERIRRSPFGLTLRAIREDDVVPAVLGKNVFAFRLRAFAIGGALIAGAGSIYAHYVQNISPGHFTTTITMVTWMAVVVGGAGNNRGLLLGAGLVMTFLEATRFLANAAPALDAERLAALRIIAVGLLLILTLRFRPQGLLPEERTRAADLAGTHSPPSPSKEITP